MNLDLFSLILKIDHNFFFWINHLPHVPLTDGMALALSGVGTAGIIWFITGAWLILREERKDHWFWLPLIITSITV